MDPPTDESDTESSTGNSSQTLGKSVSFNNIPSRPHEELRCVVAVIRHGDRTPKQ